MKKGRYFFLLAYTSIAIACLTFLITEICSINVTKEFQTKDYLDDYDYLWEYLGDNYIFFSIIEEDGIEVSDMRRRYRNEIKSNCKNINQFYFQIEKMFREFNNFAHIDILDKKEVEILSKFYLNDGIENEWDNILTDKQIMNTYSILYNNEYIKNKNDSSIYSFYDSETDSVIFQIDSFSSTQIEREEDYLEKYFKSLGNVPIENVVFDISRNIGGNDLYWIKNIVQPFGGKYIFGGYTYLKKNEVNCNFFNECLQMRTIDEISKIHDIPEFVYELGLTHCYIHKCCIESDAKIKINAKRWVLIDKMTYSSADSFAYFCKSTGWAKLVGKRTGGSGFGLPPIAFKLPKTGLLVRFDISCTENVEGKMNEIYGTNPDYYSKPKECPMDTYRRIVLQ